jgi:hypothetical protein
MKAFSGTALFLVIAIGAFSQFPPAAGLPGSTAIFKDSSIFIGWATSCTVTRGWQDISNHSLGKTTAGEAYMATGKSGENGVVSLGDGGSAVLTFAAAIFNGPGWDFAVFENAFDDNFLELAFVEVSSDGSNFFRFPASSFTQTTAQTGTFDYTDPTKVNNLAGKYRLFYGTPFDLEELKGTPGLDIDNVTHVRVVDVVGNIQPQHASKDAEGRIINDPWPTPFPQGGFDLDAVGVINQKPLMVETNQAATIKFYPNPAKDKITIGLPHTIKGSAEIYSLAGKLIAREEGEGYFSIDLTGIPAGFYAVTIKFENSCLSQRLIILE